MIAAASDAFWKGGGACGSVYKVTCLGATNEGVPHPCSSATVVVRIVDYCPSGCRGTIDLSQEAFAHIADPDAGKIRIAYDRLYSFFSGCSSFIYLLYNWGLSFIFIF
ncbi:EG45-like domain containing protein [Acorus gramineus]|uniref:EG45-like domain containing protein n=1 Tax=Acorus gramineus TaxID=55184 RepID=A0AAV9AK33_ACOGR|nr:EG45-like domain containing protein [Acorus gramineus]